MLATAETFAQTFATADPVHRPLMLRIRTQREMIDLGDDEAEELRERLRRSEAALPIEETIAVATNASTSVTFTEQQKTTLRAVLDGWLDEVGAEAMGRGAFALRNALVDEAERSGS